MKTSKYLCVVIITISLFSSGICFAQTPLEIITESHTGGWSNEVAANQDNVFLLQSYSLRTMTFDGTTFSTIGSVTLPWTGLLMYPSGSDVFVGSDNNLARVDISNINGPSIITTASPGTAVDWINSIFAVPDKVFITQFNTYTKTGSFKILNKNDLSILGSVDVACQDVFVSGNTAYVITGHKSIGASSQFLKIYNISNPSAITETGGIQLDGAEKISVSGGYAYIVGSNRNGLTVVDISNPVNPSIVADRVLTNNLTSISISGNTAYIANAGNIYFVDITTPSNPVQIGNIVFSAYTYSSTVVAVGGQTKYLLCVQNGTFNSYNITNPQTPVEGPQNESPSKINTIAIAGDNFFGGDGTSLWKSGLNSDVLTKYYPINNKIISSAENKIYIVYDESNFSKLTILDISAINSPVQKGTYQSSAKIFKIAAKGNYVYLLLENSKTIEVVDVSNINSPVKIFTYQLTGNGTSLFAAKESETNILYAGYYGNENNKGIELIDISNPAALLKLSTISTGGNSNALHADNNILYVGSHTSNEAGWYLEAFNAANPQSPVLAAQTSKLSEGEIIWDIFAIKNNLAVSFAVSGLRTYELIQSGSSSNKNSSFIQTSALDNSIAQTGTSSDVHFPKDIAANLSGNDLNVFTNAGWWHPSSHYNFDGSKGVFKVKVPKFKPGGSEDDEVNLTMSIKPADAVNHGCTTSPAPGGPYPYPKGASVELKATDNPIEGWYFKEWTGAAGGKSTTIVMDEDKNVIANFAEVILTVTGSELEKAICPSNAMLNQQKLLPITLCASPASSWAVQSIIFQASGTGDEIKDVWVLNVNRGATPIGSGTYSADNGLCEISFTPPVIVPANECVTLNLNYMFNYDITTYAIDTTYTFLVETKKVNASPLSYPEGLIEGKAKRKGPFTIARIYNTNGFGFSKIQDAVNAETTSNGDYCYLCDGVYEENVRINAKSKEITVTSVNGKENVTIKRKIELGYVIEILRKNKVTIQNISFEAKGKLEGKGVWIWESDNIIISGCAFRNFLEGLFLDGITNSLVENNLFDSNKYSVTLFKAEENGIAKNTFINSISDGPDILVFKGKTNFVYDNTILQPNGRLDISLNSTSDNKIFGNDAPPAPGSESYSSIYLENSNDNEIFGHKGYEVYLENSHFNDINLNELLQVRVLFSKLNQIYVNKISGKGIIGRNGIVLFTSERNSIYRNEIENNEMNGIEIINSSLDNFIFDNTINHNKIDGISISKDSRGNKISKNTINNNGRYGINTSSAGTEITQNKINGHDKKIDDDGVTKRGAGVVFDNTDHGYVYGNVLKENCTAIELYKTHAIRIGSNEVSNSLCLFTGIHLNNSEAEIFGNNIINNQGNGIFFSNNSNGIVRANNIFGNSEFGVNNSEPSIAINASNNWWGTETGPSSNDATGNLIISSWLAAPVSLFCNTARDTVYISAGKMDSSLVHFQNFKFPNDVLDISVSDNLGWITSPGSFTSQMEDSLGTSANIIFSVPADVNEGVASKVSVTAQSQTEPNVSVMDSFYIFVYSPLLQEIIILPDSAEISVGDSILFYVSGEDQYGNSFGINPLWQASLGEINSDGLFKCSTKGTAVITVTDSSTGMQETAVVIIDDVVAVEKDEKIIPTEYSLFQNYPNPFNPTTTIKFGVPVTSMVNIEVFNILGERVARLANEIKEAGYHAVQWNSNGLASGIYFYMINAKANGSKNFMAVKKMLLLK